jgi:hypothetical protein
MPTVSRATVERVVRCPFSVAHDYAADFFRAAEGRGIEVRVPLRDFFYGVRGKVRRPVRLVFALHPDEAEDGRVHDAMMMEWTGGTRLLPDFHGTLRLRIETVDTTRLALEGAWRPPFGAAGRLFDLLLGRAIAAATMRDLLDRIAAALERREATYRNEGRVDGASGTVT